MKGSWKIGAVGVGSCCVVGICELGGGRGRGWVRHNSLKPRRISRIDQGRLVIGFACTRGRFSSFTQK
jgi:hypothetical protein